MTALHHAADAAPSELLAPGDVPIVSICGQRDASIRQMLEAVELIRRGHELAEQARASAVAAANGTVFSLVDRSQDAAFRRLFHDFEPDASVDAFRKHADACIWMHLLRVAGIEHLMDATAREEFFRQLSSDVPEVTEENVAATLDGLRGDARLIFQRGLARVFTALDKRFRSHDAFRLGARVVLTHVFDAFGSWNYHSQTRAMIADVERTLAVLDGQAPKPGELRDAIDASRQGWGPRQGVVETRYLRIRTFKNGNAHLWFTRDDLVAKANQVLADYYGAVLPDAAPRDVEIKSKAGLPALNLSFYPTPAAVVDALLQELYIGDRPRVLEPSAGTGAIAAPMVRRGWQVEAVEIEPERVAALGRIGGLRVLPGNFLAMPARPEFDAVVMNPPFYGTHWMEHVVHAFDWLKPGGVLRAVLPATAEIAETPKHDEFRAWATARSPYGRLRFRELPAESFASSGTRISTVILELHQGARR
jgi:hypothetical protein